MADATAGTPSGDRSVELGGCQQELKRTLGPFQVFAISFAFLSVAVGTFSAYDDVLQNAGPVGSRLWVIATAGEVLVALVVAQLAARIPLSGSRQGRRGPAGPEGTGPDRAGPDRVFGT
ncbi:hypothetical protein [Streptomyces sp. NPDC058773]|uniref:hypothetical protein n=1 Tax=Streptomyces sp. NPDC058773 TaxID=3346632 RepID=UPI00368D6A84